MSLEPAAWICGCSHDECGRGRLFFDSTHPENTGWRCDSTNHIEDRMFKRDEPLFAASDIIQLMKKIEEEKFSVSIKDAEGFAPVGDEGAAAWKKLRDLIQDKRSSPEDD